MPALARTRSYQYLDCYTGTPGVPADAYSVEFTIFDISTDARKAVPEQVYPVSGARSVLDVVADKVGAGHYRTAWAPVDAGTTLWPRGRHRITWYWKLTAGGTDYETSEEFDVVATGRSWGYCLPSDLRDEGLTTTEAGDQRLANVIQLATQMIERYCVRWFEPRVQTFQLDARQWFSPRVVDGTIRRVLAMPQPIVALTSIAIADTPVALTDIKVYNRHLEGLTTPDDREIPKIEWLLSYWSYGLAWLEFSSNFSQGLRIVDVTGVFGYTDPDGSVVGVTPAMIQHACKLLVMREFPTMSGDVDTREDRQQRWRVVSDRTRDQQVGLAPRVAGSFTGDPDVDRLLDAYRRISLAAGV